MYLKRQWADWAAIFTRHNYVPIVSIADLYSLFRRVAQSLSTSAEKDMSGKESVAEKAAKLKVSSSSPIMNWDLATSSGLYSHLLHTII